MKKSTTLKFIFLYGSSLAIFVSVLWFAQRFSDAQPLKQSRQTQQVTTEQTGAIVDKNQPFGAVGNQKYTIGDFWNGSLSQQEKSIYEALKKALLQEYLKQNPEIAASTKEEVTDAEIEEFYQDNKLSNQGSLEELRGQIAQYLRQYNADQNQEVVFEKALSSGKIKIIDEPGYLYRFTNETAIARGSRTGKVALIEFSDYQCPYCQAFQNTVKEAVKEFPQVAFFYRHFPLVSIHPEAFWAGNAAECANDVGVFAQTHDWLFKNQQQLSQEALLTFLNPVLTGESFDTFQNCVEQQKYSGKINADMQLGFSMGVKGTPSFFIGTYDEQSTEINGELFSGNWNKQALFRKLQSYLKKVTPKN